MIQENVILLKPMTFHAQRVQPVIDFCVRGLCTKPYPNHPKGCPNFGKKDDCPPQEKLITEVFNMHKQFWFLWAEFDFAAHRAKMRAAHPEWSDRQVDCCLYWRRCRFPSERCCSSRKRQNEKRDAWKNSAILDTGL